MKSELKVVIDTNVFVSALIGKSKTLSRLYEAFLDAKFTPLLSLDMLAELVEVIRRHKFKKYLKLEDVKRFEELIKTDTILVAVSRTVNICRDQKDNILLECAACAERKPDFIVSGDDDLLVLKSFHGIPIIRPKDFLKYLKP
jgi:putative PIN family toxin of toxin-antitoxin system